MKPLLLILVLATNLYAQKADPNIAGYEWKVIKEMTGDIPNHLGLKVETYAAEIARGEHKVKLLLRMDFPDGAPVDIFRDAMPSGFDISSITRVIGRLQLDCNTLIVKPGGGTADVYQFNGKKHKSREPTFGIKEGHIFEKYFCERGGKPTKAPTLKPK